MKQVFYQCMILLMVFFAVPAWGMTSTNYLINWDSLNEGGLDSGTSTNYTVRDTIGDFGTGTSTSLNYQLSAGYRAGTDTATSTISFTVKGPSEGTKVAYSAFGLVAKTVTVSAIDSYTVGDYIAVVENLGFSQKVVVGRIASIGGTTITVDSWQGAGGMSAVPAGGNDFVYQMSVATAGFVSVSTNTENTSMTMSSVQSSAVNGYTMYMQADQLLQNAGGDIIPSVVDGTVTLGSEEYGASTTGTAAYLPDVDLGVSTTRRMVQSSAAATTDPADRAVIIYKLSILGTTPAGSYSQNVFYTLTANY